MKILLAVDGSSYTEKAVKYITTHLEWFKGSPELSLLHVRPTLPTAVKIGDFGSDAVQDYYKDESHEALAPAEKILRDNNIPFKAEYIVGDIAEEITAYAQKNAIDLIVMGSHGHSALAGLVMGSAATKVLSTTTIPVLVIR